jgi:vitamin B12/bleomycin/antimicrobial peptide transport system ATP-binding/permease protein
MKPLSIGVGLFGIVALVVAATGEDATTAFLGVAALLCAFTTFNATTISSFLKIFIGIFSTETIVFGLAVLTGKVELWPAAYAEYLPPESLPLTVAIFSILVYLVARIDLVRQITRIADRYFEASESAGARIWPFRPFTAMERRIAVAMVVFLVLINQAQVGILVRLSFFNRDLFNAIQSRDGAMFWQQLLFVFTPWVFIYVASAVIEFFTQSMLVIRWRRWLTDHLIARWLTGHTHYHISLVGTQADNPDQRIQEDVHRFIDGGSDGATTSYGLYSYSILLISTLSSLVSFSIVLWSLSENFTLPGTDIKVPGFLFWVALAYAATGTLITHVIGRSLIGLYFERQHMEADFRFSLARLREYTEQVALLRGENAEQSSLGHRFGAVIANYIALIRRRMKLLAFTATFGQISPIIPYVFTAPFYFAGTIQLGIMTQTADAFGRVADALTFFINYYTSLAGFKSVVDRLSSFDQAIEHGQALEAAGPQRYPAPAGVAKIELENVDVALPNGRHIVTAKELSLARGENVLLTGPSGSGKSTLFRAISGIWPYGEGRIRIPEGASVMVVPQKPYIPIATLRAAVAYPSEPGAYGDNAIRKALTDAHLGGLIDQLDREDIWAQRLSGGEQQRISLARALLLRPDWLFLDESTSALDEKLEAEMYAALAAHLPKTTIISIGHRSTLAAFHRRRLDMVPEGDRFTPQDAAKVAAE